MKMLENSNIFYQLLEEAIDFLNFFENLAYKEIQVNKIRLQCLYKISIFINKNVIFSYSLLTEKLINLFKSLIGNLFFHFKIKIKNLNYKRKLKKNGEH